MVALWVADKADNRVLRVPADTVAPVITKPTLANGKPIISKTKIKSLARIIGTSVEAYTIAQVIYTVTYSSGKPAVTTTSPPVNATLFGPALASPTTTPWEIKPLLPSKKGSRHTITVTGFDNNGNMSAPTIFTVKIG